MCLRVNFRTKASLEKFAKGKIAKRNIPVKKVIKKNGYSPYYSLFKYEKGFEYYQTGEKFVINKLNKGSFYICRIHKGLHSVKSLEDYRRSSLIYNENIHECVTMIIPKGSTYYYHDGFYVSDRLIYV